MQPNTTYVVDPRLGQNQASGLNTRPNYGPGATTTTTTVTKEIDQYQQAPLGAGPNIAGGPGYVENYDQNLDKHGKLKKEKKAKGDVYQDTKNTRGQDQVIVPPGPAIVPAVVIPVIGGPQMNSGFLQPQANQGQYEQTSQVQYSKQPNQSQYAGQIQAPTSGVLPPTGVQNPMTATLPINMQGLNPTSQLNANNIAVQPPILSTPGCNAQYTKEMIGKQHPISGTTATNTSYNSTRVDQGQCFDQSQGQYPHQVQGQDLNQAQGQYLNQAQGQFQNQGPEQLAGAGPQDTLVKQTVFEERKEIIGGPGISNRQF